MRVVIDTNIWVSGLLWRGSPWELVRLAETGRIELCLSPAMLTELFETLAHSKFQPRLAQLGLTHTDLMIYAANLASVFDVAEGNVIVAADPDDDIFLRCAVTAGAAVIVSGDHHLLDLGRYAGIPILTVREFFEQFEHFSGA